MPGVTIAPIDPAQVLQCFIPGRVDAVLQNAATVKATDLLPLDLDELVRNHLAGRERLGLFLLDPEDRVRYGCVDIDTGSVATAVDVLEVAKAWGVPVAIERSKSKGFHVFTFYSEWVPAAQVRSLLTGIVRASRNAQNKIEIFPRQDKKTTGGFGNAVFIPWHGKSLADTPHPRTCFVDPASDGWKPLKDQIAHVMGVRQLSAQDLQDLLVQHGLDAGVNGHEPAGPAVDSAASSSSAAASSATSTTSPPSPSSSGAKGTTTTTLPLMPCLEQAYSHGVDEGYIANTGHLLARAFKKRGLPQPVVESLVVEWDARTRGPHDLAQAKKKLVDGVRSAFAQDYTAHSCELLPPALRERCGSACVAQPKASPEAAVVETTLGEPTLDRVGLDLRLTRSGGVVFELKAIKVSRAEVRGELTVFHEGRRLSWGRHDLASTMARDGLRKRLVELRPKLPWRDLLEDSCYLLTEAARVGEPIIELTGQESAQATVLLPRLLYAGEPTLVFADGDTGKSLTATAVALAVQSGVALPFGLVPTAAGAVAYLDWETSAATIDWRLALLSRGWGISAPRLFYKRMPRSLVEEATTLAAEFARRQIKLVIVDSMIYAVASTEGGGFHEPSELLERAPALRGRRHPGVKPCDRPGCPDQRAGAPLRRGLRLQRPTRRVGGQTRPRPRRHRDHVHLHESEQPGALA